MVDLNRIQSSNVWKHIGMEIVENNEGQPGVKVRNSENLKQFHGNIHGGIIAMAVDAAVGVAVYNLIGTDHAAVTVELKVNFLYPVVNSDIFAFAKIVKKGKQIITSTVEVLDDEGTVVAVGIATFMIKY